MRDHHKLSRLTAAALAASALLSLTAFPAYADKLSVRDGITYRYSDSSESKGKFTGWAKTSDGSRYYYKDGVMLKSTWLTVKGVRTYFLRKNGKMAVGDVKIDDTVYTFGTDGKLFPDNFGTKMTVNETKENITLCLVTSESVMKSYDCTLERGAMPLIERKNGSKWEKLEIPAESFEILDRFTDDNRYYFERIILNNGVKADNGQYRVTKEFTVKYDGFSGGSKTYTFTQEFEIDDSTDHAIINPPDLTITAGGKEYTALKGTYSWDNAYSDTNESVGVEADAEGALHSKEYMPFIDVKAGESIKISPEFGGTPASITLKCWEEKYWEDYDAYGKSTPVTVTDMSFIPKKGGYIYEIKASWGRFEINDVTMEGNCYYSFFIRAE